MHTVYNNTTCRQIAFLRRVVLFYIIMQQPTDLLKALTRIIVNAIVMMTRKVVKGAMNMPLRNQLKEHRSRMGINQTELGKLAGVSRQTISLIERGDYSPSVALALKLAKICGVQVEDIFQYEEDES